MLEPLLLLSESSPSLVASLIHLAFLERNRNSPSEGLTSVLSKAIGQQQNGMRDNGKGAAVALDLFTALRCVVQIALWRRDVEDVRKAISSVVYAGMILKKKGVMVGVVSMVVSNAELKRANDTNMNPTCGLKN